MRTVFIIDDDGLMREVLSRLLEKSGYRVRAFPSPCRALPLIDSEYPDAIVSDVQMPGMSGLELADRVRELAARTPVILMTGAVSPEMSDEARRLGVRELFEKPIKDVNRLVTVLDRAVSDRDDEERSAGLDALRLSFLTGLAHELRTPLTAMKLALESLFAGYAAHRGSAEGRLLAISQRNLDRIVRLVEGQLDLLQITLGDVSVARRLVSVRDLLERAAADTPPGVRKRVVIDGVDKDAAPRERPFCFTDPDRLRAVVRYLLEAARIDEDRSIVVRCSVEEDGRKIRLHFDGAALPAETTCAGDRASGIASYDAFETRAFRRIVASLGGEIGSGGGPERAHVSLLLPARPRFDLREDFETPIGCLREAAMLSGRTVCLLKCEVPNGAPGASCFSAEEEEFFGRCRSALSEGDALVRARPDGTYYLGLVERGAEEIDHIAAFLGAPSASGDTVRVSAEPADPAVRPEDLRPDEAPSRADGDLETVGEHAS